MSKIVTGSAFAIFFISSLLVFIAKAGFRVPYDFVALGVAMLSLVAIIIILGKKYKEEGKKDE
jgi:hypothetical protein